jgi:hypothetical protein
MMNRIVTPAPSRALAFVCTLIFTLTTAASPPDPAGPAAADEPTTFRQHQEQEGVAVDMEVAPLREGGTFR